MSADNSAKSCVLAQLPLRALCANTSTNDSHNCKDVDVSILFITVDCYLEGVFPYLINLFIVLGTLLNLYSLCTFLKINKRNSQNVYLSVLSLADTINLHINFALPMIRQWDAFDTVFCNSLIICRLTGVLTEFFLIFPTWIVVLLTIERLIAMSFAPGRRPLFTQHRAKFSIVLLAVLVLGLSVYRYRDLRGIDQISVFGLVTCNATDEPVIWMRNTNLMIWTIVPECFTLLMSLIIIYQIRSVARKLESDASKARRSKYNQATRTVLLIAILFLVFHTPTGITIALDLFYGRNKTLLQMLIILSSRKLTILLYEINLSCKFFIYNRTFRHFRVLRKLVFQFTRQPNSAKLGRRMLADAPERSSRPRIHFAAQKPSMTSPTSPSDSCTKPEEDHQRILNSRQVRTYSTNLSRSNRDQQLLQILNSESNKDTRVPQTRKSNLSNRSFSFV